MDLPVVRDAVPEDAAQLAAVYEPWVRTTAVSFELTAPTAEQMAARMLAEPRLPWLVAQDPTGVVGYAYASSHRARPAYRWSVDVSVYLRSDACGRGTGRRLYAELLATLTSLGYVCAFAGIALPNAASVGLHEALGFTLVGVYRDVGFKHGRWHDVGWWSRALQSPPDEPQEPRAWEPGGASLPSRQGSLPDDEAPTHPAPMTTHEHEQHRHPAPGDSAEWDARYGEAPIWSGDPNGGLVAEVADLPAGRALDVGCGEGADAVWLARRGWSVTGLDVSKVALDRAAGHAADAGVAVTWLHSGLVEADLPGGSFDLVSAQYPALLRTPGQDAERALLAAVAPGGVLIVVHHAAGPDSSETGFERARYVLPEQVAAALDDDWAVEVDETRPRVAPSGGAGAHHVDDVVLVARRLR